LDAVVTITLCSIQETVVLELVLPGDQAMAEPVGLVILVEMGATGAIPRGDPGEAPAEEPAEVAGQIASDTATLR